MIELLTGGKKNMTLDEKKLLMKKIEQLVSEEREKNPISKQIAIY